MDPIRSLSRRSSQSEGGSIGVYSRLFSSLWLRLCRVVFFCGYSLSVLMKIVVFGLWHLGCVTAACAAKVESVIGVDFDTAVVTQFRNGKPPLFEPGLAELINEGVQSGRLAFFDNSDIACRDAD